MESHTGRLLPHETVGADGVTSSKHLFKPGQILYSKIRPYLAKAVRVDFEGLCSADVYPIDTELVRDFLFYWILTAQFTERAIQHQGRSVLPKINQAALRKLPVPVAPRAEQERIVAALEEHLSRLDAAEASLESARRRVDLLGRSAISRLFASTDWEWTTLGEIAHVRGGVTKDTKKQSDPDYVEVPYLRVANVQRGYLDLGDVSTIRVKPSRAQDLMLEPGDVLFNEGGDRDKLGRGGVWEGQVDGCIHQNHVFRARLADDRFDPYFVSTHGNTWGREWFSTHGKQTTNLASINLTTLKQFPVPAPSIDVQREVMAQLDELGTQLNHLEQELAATTQRGNILRHSVLAAAFSGKLVPQDPSDEPASRLLERIRAERNATKSNRRKKAKS